MDTNTGQRLIQIAEGQYVLSDVLNVVEKVMAYDQNLRIKYCDPDKAEFGDAPYKIVEVCPDGFERLVFDVWELNERVLERLYRADTFRNNILAQIQSQDELARQQQHRRYRESMDEAKDIVEHVVASPKGRYSFPRDDGAIVTVDDDVKRSHTVKEKD